MRMQQADERVSEPCPAVEAEPGEETWAPLAALERLGPGFRHLVEATSDGVLLVSVDGSVDGLADGVILGINDAGCGMFGRARARLVGGELQSVEDGALCGLAELARESARESTTGGSLRRELMVARPDGSRVELEITAISLLPHAPLVALFTRDVTERRLNEAGLALRNELTEALAQARSISEVGPKLLELLGRCLGRVLGGELWLVEGEQRRLVLRATWVPEGAPGEGLLLDAEILRPGAVRFPLSDGGEVLGVVVLAGDDTSWSDARSLSDRTQALLSQMAQFVRRTRAERQRDELARQRQLALDAARMGWWHYDPRTRVATFDEGYTAIFGISGHERPNEEILKLLHPDDLPRVWAAVEAAIDPVDPQPYCTMYRINRPDGCQRWVEAHGLTVFEGEGSERSAVRFVGTVADVTDRVRAQQALERSRREIATLAENAPDIIVRFDRQMRHLYVNAAVTRATGMAPEEFLGKTNEELGMPPDQCRLWREVLTQVLETGVERELEFAFPSPDGPRDYSLRAVPERDSDGQVQSVLCITRDITERKRAEAAVLESERKYRALSEHLRAVNLELAESDRRKNEFIAVLSHELRNPLAPIRNSIYLAERAPAGSDQARRALKVIDRQTRHLTRMVEDLLDITRIVRGRIQLQKESLELTSLVRAAAEDHRWMFDELGVELQLNIQEAPLWLEGDRTRLAQALGNLLSNAAKFTPRGGKAELTLEERDHQVLLSVRDTGIGMRADTLSALFEPFTQAPQPLARTSGGLGLGLALVRGLVELHGGGISASSQGDGRGSEFLIRLPVEFVDPRQPVTGEGEVPAVGERLGQRRVLIIEDNVDAAESLGDLLRLLGCQVEIAHDGLEGIRRARTYRPDVLVCDVGLPGMNGYDVARALRGDARFKETRLIALTGYALPDDVAEAKAAGFDAHLAKPPSAEALALAVVGSC